MHSCSFCVCFCSASLLSSQAAKLKCVLNYFDRSLEQEDDSGVSAVICLTRQVSRKMIMCMHEWRSVN